ncbi:hypothetical protein FMUND_14342 [Fusarium mundagurra]|uniref:Uncharacterized protein n=1 Tax=Fusarium mundagurra TaxID=1567541 RepID=A0A8H5XUF8_9HYPO|nr:hypothetical protein FMUND_14342 [Fusarium mundagurra]
MRLEVLLSVRYKESINSLIRASPTLFQSYISFKAQILPSLVAADLDDELVQHAVAIVQFPKSMTVGKEHLAAWDNRQLPNPFQGHYPEVFEEINKLHSLILRLMQDYITKATSRFPPREYLCVPNIHAFAADGHSVFRGQKITTMVRTDVLTDNERKRFLKASLLFELNCKVVKSGLGVRLRPVQGIAYEVPKVLVPLRGDDALRCIHTYVCSLHGAIFAQCGDAWLPEPRNESSLEPGLLFPDSLYLDPNTYMLDLGIPQAHGGELAAEFTKLGLELVVELLGYDISDPQQKESLLVRLEDFWDLYPRLSSDYCHHIAEVSPSLVDEGPMYYQLNLQLTSALELQKKVFEQRAWVFFDDARLYPSRSIACHFPSAAFLENEGDKLVWFQGWEHNSARIRALCRSKKWHDDYKKEMDLDT